jgi:hypothetical protein
MEGSTLSGGYMPAETVELFLFKHCSRGVLEELSETSAYWADVRTFVEKNLERNIKLMSQRESRWLYKIKNDLLEEASK